MTERETLPPSPKRQTPCVRWYKETKAIDAGQSRVSGFAAEKPNLFVLWRGDHARGDVLKLRNAGQFCGLP
jgi:hypothetical protein